MPSEASNTITIRFTETVLRLSPWLGELEPGVQCLLLGLSALVPLGLVLWLYRYEMRLVTCGAARFLLSLRLAVLALIWCVVCLRPVLVTTRSRELPSRVVVALDVSDSMRVTDPRRPAVEKLRLARALRLPLPGNGDTAGMLDDWIKQYQTKGDKARPGDLEWVRPGEAPGDERKRRELARRRRAYHDQICAAVDRLSRLEISLRLLKTEGGQLLGRLEQKYHVQLLAFHEKVEELAPEQLDRLLKQKTAPLTDLALPLERSLKPAAPDRGRLVGILLLTDGQHNAPSTPLRPAEHLGKRAVPIHPIVLGTTDPRPNVTVAEVQAPAKASSRDDVSVRVRFRAAGLERQSIVVTLERDNKRSDGPPNPAPVVIAHNGTDQSYDRSFVVHMDPKGKRVQSFTLAVKPAAKLPAGIPTQQLAVKLDDTRANVLIVESDARWEYHYLASALRRDPGVELQRVVFNPPLRDSSLTDAELKKMDNPARHLPRGPDALADFQCIILGDVSPEQLSLEDRLRLEQYVAKHGGILVILAGKQFTPLAYGNKGSGIRAQISGKEKKEEVEEADEKGKETDPLIKLLPIESPRLVDPIEGFHVALTQEGKGVPFLHMETDPKENEKRWASFPPHYWAVVGRAKPAATALAWYRDPAKPAPHTATEQEDEERKYGREQALMVRHPYGRGQVLYVGLDSTWRWRYRVGDTFHHRFWGQVMRWAASDHVRFGTDKPVYQEGQDVTIELALQDNEIKALPKDGAIKARIVRAAGAGEKEKTVALVGLSAAEARRILKGRVANLPPGSYRVELDQNGPARTLKLGTEPSTPFWVTPRESREMDHLEANVDLLRDLAQKSGNKDELLTPANAIGVVERLNKSPFKQVERSEQGLWQREWGTLLLMLFLGLVSVEWAVRKWAGLP